MLNNAVELLVYLVFLVMVEKGSLHIRDFRLMSFDEEYFSLQLVGLIWVGENTVVKLLHLEVVFELLFETGVLGILNFDL